MLRAVVVEDEKASRDRLRRLLDAHRGVLELVAEAASGPEAVNVVTEQKPDVVFLDISLPGFDGFGVLRSLTSNPAIVFTTAYDDFAVKAFRENAVDYLLKPIEPSELAAAISRLQSRCLSDSTMTANKLSLAPGSDKQHPLARIACRTGDFTIFVQPADVHYFRAEQGYTTVKTSQKELLIEMSLTELEARLDSGDFVRIHRNTLVNMNHVASLKRSYDGRVKLQLSDGSELSSSRRFAENLRRWG